MTDVQERMAFVIEQQAARIDSLERELTELREAYRLKSEENDRLRRTLRSIDGMTG